MNKRITALCFVIMCIKFVIDTYFIAFNPSWLLYETGDKPNHTTFANKKIAYGPFRHCLMSKFNINEECRRIIGKHEDISPYHDDLQTSYMLVLVVSLSKIIFATGVVFSWLQCHAIGVLICGVLFCLEGGFSSYSLAKISFHFDDWFAPAKSKHYGYAFYYYTISTATDFMISLATLIFFLRKLLKILEERNNNACRRMVLYTIAEESPEEMEYETSTV